MTLELRKLWASLAALTLASTLSVDNTKAAEFEGVHVEVLTRTGPVIAKRLAQRAEEFNKASGAVVTINEVPFAELFHKVLTDWSTGTNSIDVGVFASGWAVELAAANLVEDLTPYIEADDALRHDDIAPFFRDFNQKIGGKTKLITIDGDFQMMYYRRDVFNELGLNAPRNWEQYQAAAEATHGRDMNGDGEPDYGSCIFKKRNAQSYFAIMSVAAAFSQTRGTAQGFFFDPDTMKPLVNNDAWIEALNVYKATGRYGPPDELNHDIGDTRSLVQAGRCAMVIDWGDIGPLSIDEAGAAIKNKMAAAVMPGTSRVLDRTTGRLVDCDNSRCPHAVDGINQSPFAAFGGWAGAINSKSEDKVKQAAYAWLSYVNQPEQSNVDVTMGWTGFNPYRNSQLNDTGKWIEAGFSPDFAENYLGAIKDSLNNPNMSSDLKIPGTAQYQGLVLDRELARFLADEITAAEAVANIETGWEEITEDYGRDAQQAMYKASLGIID